MMMMEVKGEEGEIREKKDRRKGNGGMGRIEGCKEEKFGG